MKRLHLALSVADIETTVADYTRRFGQPPDLVVPGVYALWRTSALNVSVRKTADAEAGTLRHLGWEDDSAANFTSDVDCNGITWERFTAEHQAEEIRAAWPEVDDVPARAE